VRKLRRIKWAGHVALIGEREAYTRFWRGNLRVRYYLEEPGVDGRVILKWIFRKCDGEGTNWTDLA
jgi:hypothetical protein